MSGNPDCQVLVVGAGPTGLVLAIDLLYRGISVRVIDKGDGITLESRAIGIHARTLEVLDMMGLAERCTEQGQRVRELRFYANGKRLVSLDFAWSGSRFDFFLDLAQDEFQRLLLARVNQLGGAVEYGTELTGLTAGPDAVTAAVRTRAGVERTITAGYLAGCDGAHSRVRRELGLGFPGNPYPQDWLLADVSLDWDRDEHVAHAFFRPDGLPLVCFPMRGHRWRLTLPFAGNRGGQAPTLEEIQELTDQRAPEPVTVSDPSWLAAFRTHRRSASAYRRGRVLLAGDAVHIHTPVGGQGMNTGIMEAHNLGWKLALVASGAAPELLLDSYGAERRPVAEDVLRLTHTMVRLGTVSDPLLRRIRDVVVPALGRSAVVQRRAVRRLSHVYVAYPSSPLARQDRAGGGPRPGDRMPDIAVYADGYATTLHKVLRTGMHVLVVPSTGPAALLDQAGLRCYRRYFDVVTRNAAGLVVLVRPDGYVAARGRPGDLAAVAGYLRDLVGEPAARRPAYR